MSKVKWLHWKWVKNYRRWPSNVHVLIITKRLLRKYSCGLRTRAECQTESARKVPNLCAFFRESCQKTHSSCSDGIKNATTYRTARSPRALFGLILEHKKGIRRGQVLSVTRGVSIFFLLCSSWAKRVPYQAPDQQLRSSGISPNPWPWSSSETVLDRVCLRLPCVCVRFKSIVLAWWEYSPVRTSSSLV